MQSDGTGEELLQMLDRSLHVGLVFHGLWIAVRSMEHVEDETDACCNHEGLLNPPLRLIGVTCCAEVDDVLRSGSGRPSRVRVASIFETLAEEALVEHDGLMAE
jgi:hypothetical protein